MLEDGARVGHRLVEHQLEEVVAEVVVIGDVAARAKEAVPPVQAWPRLEEPSPARVSVGGRRRIPEQQLEQRDEVVAVPFARRIRLADAELPPRRDPPEEGVVVDRQVGDRAAPEAPDLASGEPHLERPALEPHERAIEDRHRDPLEERQSRGLWRAAEGALGAVERCSFAATEPSPGTNAGLRWNGTRLSQSLSACQWISATTRNGIRG